MPIKLEPVTHAQLFIFELTGGIATIQTSYKEAPVYAIGTLGPEIDYRSDVVLIGVRAHEYDALSEPDKLWLQRFCFEQNKILATKPSDKNCYLLIVEP